MEQPKQNLPPSPFAEFFEGYQRLMALLTTELPKYLAAIQRVNVAEIERGFSEQYVECYRRLADRSWFLDADIPITGPCTLLDSLDRGKEQEVEDELADYYRGRVDAIERELVQAYPHRRVALEAAFRAHRQGEYNLSIPVFLAQADGISLDTYSAHYFRARTSIPAATTYISDKAIEQSTAAFAYPLIHKGMNRAHTSTLPAGNKALNRHAILHGIDSNYGTELNSLKSISLISYLHGVTIMIANEKSRGAGTAG